MNVRNLSNTSSAIETQPVSQLIRVTKSFTLDMAHALYGYDGACKNIHGHTYRLTVTLSGMPLQDNNNPKAGMVLDFKILKEIVAKSIISVYDHALVLNGQSPHHNLSGQLTAHFEKIVFMPVQPTCENLLIHFMQILSARIPQELVLTAVRLDETPDSYAEWLASDNNAKIGEYDISHRV